jgi:hypothetical protein
MSKQTILAKDPDHAHLRKGNEKAPSFMVPLFGSGQFEVMYGKL